MYNQQRLMCGTDTREIPWCLQFAGYDLDWPFARRTNAFFGKSNESAMGPGCGKTILGDRDLPKTRMRVRLLVNNVLQKIKQSTLVIILFYR